MSKHEINGESDEQRTITSGKHESGPRRPHSSSDATDSAGLSGADLSVGDVVVIDRSVGEITAKTFATVVAIDARGPRLVGPDYPSPAFGGALDIERVTGYERVIGRDGDGAYHIIAQQVDGEQLLLVTPSPDAAIEHEQQIADDSVLAEWIEHVDAVRGWESVASEFEALLSVDRGDGVETDGGQSEHDLDRPDPSEDPRACSKCGVHIGFLGGEYCDGCAREIGAKPPLRRCLNCGQRAPQEQMESVDISTEDEYYPTIRYFCRGCPGGESA